MPPTTKRTITTNKVLLDNGCVEVRLNDDGTIDEIVTKEPVHVTYEYMDDNSIQIHIGEVVLTVWTKRGFIRTGAQDWGTDAGDQDPYGEFDD